MKKLLVILLVLVLATSWFAACGKTEETLVETNPPEMRPTEPPLEVTWMTPGADRALTAQQYFVYDCDKRDFATISGTEEERIYPASVTKLFTAYVALGFLNPKDSVQVGDDVLSMVVNGSSVADIQSGDTLTVGELVEAMLLPSGNDAAYVLALEAGRVLDENPGEDVSTALTNFVAEMNRQAQILGLKNTHFANPDGIHSDDHYTSFADAVLIGMLAMEDPMIMQYVTTSKDTKILASGEKEWKNTNALIDPGSQYYCPYATGLKTGQTPMAGSCLLSSFVCKDRTLVIGVFGCPEADDRFVDTIQLFNETMGITPEIT